MFPVQWEPISLVAMLTAVFAAVAGVSRWADQRSLRSRLAKDIDLHSRAPVGARSHLAELVAEEARDLRRRTVPKPTWVTLALLGATFGVVGLTALVAVVLLQSFREMVAATDSWESVVVNYGLVFAVCGLVFILVALLLAAAPKGAGWLWRQAKRLARRLR